ncbi:universal stress protein [Scytonema sp. NUACC26]|uniref:universal stress protein n=1 Tax=Scytonema sp. NUACC26 TaxID=3140176 RepID=UPI0034DBDB74
MDTTVAIKTILVALDDSEMSDQIMQTVQQFMLPKNSKVVLCHVFATSESNMELPADRPHPESSTFSYSQIEKQLKGYQNQLAVESEIELVAGDPAQEIVRLANIYKADLIVTGSRGLTGVDRIVRGSVSSQVVEDAPCSVLVVKGT